jgi:uncharacterized protein (TIRG00374 family)
LAVHESWDIMQIRDLPYADPGVPDARSGGRFLWWLFRGQLGGQLKSLGWGLLQQAGIATLPLGAGVAVQAVVTVALLAWLFHGLDLRAFGDLFARTPISYYLASLGVIFAGQVLYAWRWHQLLLASGVRIPVATAVRLHFIGIFASNFLPGTVGGDIVKVYYLGRNHGYRPVATSVLLDRVLGVGILAGIATAVLWTSPPIAARYVAARVAVTAIAVAVVAVLGVTLAGAGGLSDRLARFETRAAAIGARVKRFRQDVATVVRQPMVLLQAFAVVGGYFVAVAAVYRAFVELNTSAHPSFLTMVMVATTTSVLSNVPISLNGLGVREQLHVWLMEPLGVPKEAALALSLLLFAHLIVVSLWGLVLWLRSPSIRPAPDWQAQL